MTPEFKNVVREGKILKYSGFFVFGQEEKRACVS